MLYIFMCFTYAGICLFKVQHVTDPQITASQ